MPNFHSMRRRRAAITTFLFGLALWWLALWLPAVDGPGLLATDDIRVTLPGYLCFLGTLIPSFWFASPLASLPLLFASVWTLSTPLVLIDGVTNGVSKVFANVGFVIVGAAILTTSVAYKVQVGFFVWSVSLLLLAISLAILSVRNVSTPTSRHLGANEWSESR